MSKFLQPFQRDCPSTGGSTALIIWKYIMVKKRKRGKATKNIKTAQTDSLWPWWSEVIVHVKVSLKLAPCSVIVGVVEG